MMRTYDIQELSVEQLDDLYDILCEYIYDHNFDEDYVIGADQEKVELDDTVIEVRDKDTVHIEVGIIDDQIALANYKMGFLYTSTSTHPDDYQLLQDHVEDSVQQFL
ncbi:hypothetical protein H8E06_01230 [bacterium]|nr:hypothetical protein [bacterium]